MQKHLTILLLVVLGGFIVGYILFNSPSFKRAIGPPPFIHPKILLNPPEYIYNVPPPSSDDHIWGNPNAPVKVIEYSDTECPFCKINFFNMKDIVHEYNGEVAWVYRHHTLDHRYTKSRKEAEATECAASVGGEGAFWLFLEEIYRTTNSADSLDLSQLPNMVEKFGVDKERFTQCLDSGTHADRIERDNNDAFKSGLEFTPSMVIFWPDGERRSFIIGARSKDTVVAALNYILGREVNIKDTAAVDADSVPSYSQ